MVDFFNRNLTRPTQEKTIPSYLEPFELPQADMSHELYLQLKKGEYDIEQEEEMLTKLHRSLGQRGDVADKIIEKLGIIGMLRKNDGDGSEGDKEGSPKNSVVPNEDLR